MTTIGTVINLILLFVVLVLAGEWSFGLYGAVAGFVLAVIGLLIVVRLQRSPTGERRFDPPNGNPA
jgi:hypothetical protein